MPSSLSSSCPTVPARATPEPVGRAGLARITVAALLWGTTGVVVQLVSGSTGLSAVGIGFWRLAVGAAVLLLLSARRLGPLVATVRTASRPLLCVGVGLGAYHALYFLAVTAAGVSVATVVSLGLAPVLAAGWEALRARRRPAPRAVLPLVAAVGGLLLVTVSTASTPSAPQPLLGLLAAAGSGLGYAATTLLSRSVSQQVAARDLTTLSTTVGALVLAPVALVAGAGAPAGPLPLAMLLYLGMGTTAVAYGLFHAGLRTTRASTAAVLTLLEPLTATLLAAAVLSEPLPATTLAGGALLLGAVAALYLVPERDGTRPTPRRAGSASSR